VKQKRTVAMFARKVYNSATGSCTLAGCRLGLRCVPVCAGIFREIAGCPTIFAQFEAEVLAADALTEVEVVDRRQSNGGTSGMRTKCQGWLLVCGSTLLRTTSPAVGHALVRALARPGADLEPVNVTVWGLHQAYKLTASEFSVSAATLGTIHVQEEQQQDTYRRYLAFLARSEVGDEVVAKRLLQERGDTKPLLNMLREAGVTDAPQFSSFKRWEREGYRSRKLPDGQVNTKICTLFDVPHPDVGSGVGGRLAVGLAVGWQWDVRWDKRRGWRSGWRWMRDPTDPFAVPLKSWDDPLAHPFLLPGAGAQS